MNDGLRRLLNPASVAVIGASAQEGKAGNIVFRQLLQGSFRVMAVNARGGTALGRPVYRSVAELSETPDLAVVVLPADLAPVAVEECAKRGVGAAIVVAGGFGEVGESGRRLELKLKEAVAGTPTRILGPNTLGVLVPKSGLDTIFLPPGRPRRPGAGGVAVISQSGSAIVSAMDLGAFYGMGIAAFVGLGNRLDIDENELLEFYRDDPETSAVALYLESFADARRFIEVARELVKRKPLVFLRAGRSSAGARAVALHTGSLAGSDRVTDGVLRQLGIIRVYDADELLQTANALAAGRPLEGRRVAIVTGGGGMGIMTADYVEAKEHGIASSLATLAPDTERRLREVALPFASVRNPIDLTASVTSEMYDGAIRALQDDSGVDVIVCVYDYNPSGCDERLTESLCRWGREGSKALIAAVLGSELSIEGIRALNAAGVPAFPSIWSAVRAVDALARRGEFLRMAAAGPAARADVAGHVGPGSGIAPGIPLAEDEVKAALRERGIDTPRSMVLPGGALPAELPLAYPVVVKIRSSAVLHKTELKGVVLDVRDRAGLEAVVREMAARFPGVDLLVEEMEPKGVELIVGLVEDATFGLSIMCGIGGTLAELYGDVAFRLVPIDEREAEDMLRELKGYPLLDGFRGIEANRWAVIDLVLKVSRLGQELNGVVDQVDLNPVMVRGDRAVVVDAKLVWKDAVGAKQIALEAGRGVNDG